MVGGRRPTTNGWRYAPTIGMHPRFSHAPPTPYRATLPRHAYTQGRRLYANSAPPTQADRMPMRNPGKIAQSHACPRKPASPIRNQVAPLRNPMSRTLHAIPRALARRPRHTRARTMPLPCARVVTAIIRDALREIPWGNRRAAVQQRLGSYVMLSLYQATSTKEVHNVNVNG